MRIGIFVQRIGLYIIYIYQILKIDFKQLINKGVKNMIWLLTLVTISGSILTQPFVKHDECESRRQWFIQQGSTNKYIELTTNSTIKASSCVQILNPYK
jgi:hypothetical protein